MQVTAPPPEGAALSTAKSDADPSGTPTSALASGAPAERAAMAMPVASCLRVGLKESNLFIDVASLSDAGAAQDRP